MFEFTMTYKNPKPTVDGIIIKNSEILLIQRKNSPFKGCWALPGGFIEYGEACEQAVKREIYEETGYITSISSLLGVYSDPERDPRGHTISVVYLLQIESGELKAGDDAASAKFFKLDQLPELAFDHADIIADAQKKRR